MVKETLPSSIVLQLLYDEYIFANCSIFQNLYNNTNILIVVYAKLYKPR